MLGTPAMPIAEGLDYYVIFNIISPDFISSTDYSNYNNVKDSNEVYYLNPIEVKIYVDNKTTLTTASNYNTQGNCDVYTEYTLVGTISVEVDGAASLYYGGAEMCANTRHTFAVRSLTFIADGVEQ